MVKRRRKHLVRRLFAFEVCRPTTLGPFARSSFPRCPHLKARGTLPSIAS